MTPGDAESLHSQDRKARRVMMLARYESFGGSVLGETIGGRWLKDPPAQTSRLAGVSRSGKILRTTPFLTNDRA